MPPTTDYVRHTGRLARKALAKALEEIAAGLEQASRRE
jgi:hypothetical protein